MKEPRSGESSGTVLYRRSAQYIEILLVHPSGNFNRRAPWGIPKGHLNPGEDHETAARRETVEETGVIAGQLTAIGHIDYRRSRKRVYAFAGLAPLDATPRCASWEVDHAAFIELTRARRIIHPDQGAFLDRLLAMLEGVKTPASEPATP